MQVHLDYFYMKNIDFFETSGCKYRKACTARQSQKNKPKK